MTFDSTILNALLVPMASIILDTLMGVGIAIKQKTFSLSILPDFLANNLLPYVGGLVLLALSANYVPTLDYLFYGAVGLVTVKFSKEALIDKMKTIFE